MLAFHNDPAVREQYLNRVAAHASADELLQGYGYWRGGKGCAVGCTIHGSTHKSYETELGIPEEIAYLEDWLFERLPAEKAKEWAHARPSLRGAHLECVSHHRGWLAQDPLSLA